MSDKGWAECSDLSLVVLMIHLNARHQDCLNEWALNPSTAFALFIALGFFDLRIAEIFQGLAISNWSVPELLA